MRRDEMKKRGCFFLCLNKICSYHGQHLVFCDWEIASMPITAYFPSRVKVHASSEVPMLQCKRYLRGHTKWAKKEHHLPPRESPGYINHVLQPGKVENIKT